MRVFLRFRPSKNLCDAAVYAGANKADGFPDVVFAKAVRGLFLVERPVLKRSRADLYLSALAKLDQAGFRTVQWACRNAILFFNSVDYRRFGSFDDEDLIGKQRSIAISQRAMRFLQCSLVQCQSRGNSPAH